MYLLRIAQSATGKHSYRVEVSFEGDGLARHMGEAKFKFKLTAQEHEDLRWYLEDFLQYPVHPAPDIAARVERMIAEKGAELFRAVFEANDQLSRLWAVLADRLNDTRVEITTSVAEATAIPWELIRDPVTDAPLALRARAFVRALPQSAQTPRLPACAEGPVRILLVICRPKGREDVPFRSVASRIIKGLGGQASGVFQLDLLRPPTFARLGEALRQAREQGRPYHIVHFDGHGDYLDTEELEKASLLGQLNKALSSIVLSGHHQGKHGYVFFEDPAIEENLHPVDGTTLGKLLAEVGAPVLVLNACRSAHAEPPAEPEQVKGDVHSQVRAMGSLAQEIMDAGAAGVVAMRYVVYVVTAAQFVADLYAALASGLGLGQAVSNGRKQLAAAPLREVGADPLALQDWSVPVVYEAAEIKLFPPTSKDRKITITLDEKKSAPGRGDLDPKLPPRPDVGFFGRDETILALDRAFDDHRVVLLHAFAGAGKTTAAAEFARWYSLTGGVDGPVLFTKFEHHTPVARLVDQVGALFGPSLEASGVNWSAITDPAARKQIVLQVLAQVPVLWIWDNVEPVAGFPEGTPSEWKQEERDELKDFLRKAGDTQAKFLLTSRRDEHQWLGNFPKLVTMPPMPFAERVQLARGLAAHRGRPITDLAPWKPLLRYTLGNPLTITVLVGEALRQNLSSAEAIQRFVDQIRTGEANLSDNASQGRTVSLAASLNYGFQNAFTEDERKVIALLHLFQGFVDVDALKFMGDPDEEWCLTEIKGLTRESGISLLDRAAEVGLLEGHGGGYYSIHPALPWFFKDLFARHYPETAGAQAPDTESAKEDAGVPALKAMRAYSKAMGSLGEYYLRQYYEGHTELIAVLLKEEDNLLHARRLAIRHSWWEIILSPMQGLQALYNQTGRNEEWKRLVDEIIPLFVAPETDGPLPGREQQWGILTQHRVHIARDERHWKQAERLQRKSTEWASKQAEASLALSPKALTPRQRNSIRSLAASLHDLGQIQREQGDPACLESYREAFALAQRIEDRAFCCVCAFNIGNAYYQIPSIRNLDQAEHWLNKDLELELEGDNLGRAKCFNNLGALAIERFKEARVANRAEAELIGHLNQAAQKYRQALDLIPDNAIFDLAVAHNQLGVIYGYAGDVDKARKHWNESIRYKELQGNIHGAARSRFNLAMNLASSGRFQDALDYAHAALNNFQTFGDRAAGEIQDAQELIARIESAMKSKS